MNLRDIRYEVRYKGDKIIFVSPTKILDRLEQDSPSYSIRGGKNQIGNRVQRAKEYIIKNWNNPEAKKIQRYPIFEPSVVGIYNDIISFGDGRHRILAAEELGIPEVAVEIPRNQEHLFDYMKVKPEFISESKKSILNDDIVNEFIDLFDNFLKGNERNKWIYVYGFKMYVRKSKRVYNNELISVIDLATIESVKRGTGLFTLILKRILDKYKEKNFFIENVMQRRFYNFFKKFGFVDYRNSFEDNGCLIKISKSLNESPDYIDKYKKFYLNHDALPFTVRSGKDPLKYYKSLGKQTPLAYKQAIYQEKMNESPDNIIYKEQEIKWTNGQALPFDCVIESSELKVCVGDWGTSHVSIHHQDNWNLTIKYPGRLWISEKIISFWTYPNRKDFEDIINQLEVILKEKIINWYGNISNKIWNNGWKIEIFLFKGEVAIDKNYLQCISSKNGKENITTKLIPIEEYLKSEDQPDELRKLHLMSSAEKDMLRKSGKDPLKYYKSLGSNKNIEPIDILKNKQLMYQENMKNRKDYLDWKRKNVTLRGIKELGKYNDVYGSFGKGLYTVPLSNKIMTKQYGKLYYVINAIPKHPKIVDSLNNAEIWIQNLIINFSKNNNRKEYYDLQFFKENTTIEDEMIKLGYDGLIIKGREMVNYKPHQDVKYFETENELEKYFEFITMYQEKMNESPDHIDKYNLTYKNDYAIPFIGHLQGDDVIVAIGEGGETHDSISIKGFKWVDDNCRNYSGRLWLNKKIISFWNYPNREVFVKIIDELEEKLKLKIWNKKWTIETVFFDKNTPIDRQVPDWRMVNGTSDVQIISIENYMKSEDVPDEERQLHLMSSAEKDMLRKAGKDPLKYYKSLGSNKNIEPIDILKNKQLMYQEKVLYKLWKNEHYKSNESIITKFQDFENNI